MDTYQLAKMEAKRLQEKGGAPLDARRSAALREILESFGSKG